MRGKQVPVGTIRVAKNGYSYTKIIDPETKKQKWRLTHHIIAEEKILKRPLEHNERVAFIGSMRNLDMKNIIVKKKELPSLQRQINAINDKIAELEDRRDFLKEQLKKERKVTK